MAELPPLPPGFKLDQAPAGLPGRTIIRRAAPPPAPKTTYKTLSAAEVKSLGLPPGSYQRSSEGKVDKVADAPKVDPAKDVNFRDPIDKIIGVIDAAASAHRMTRKGGLSSSPIGRVVGSYVPGTGPRDLSGYLDTIGGNTAFETLQQMRQDSPTGGAVGNVSDADMRLLRSTIASLDPGQGNDKFQKDLSTVLRSYQKVLYGLPGGREAYHGWRVKWLGYDPAKKAPAAKSKAGGFEFLGFEE